MFICSISHRSANLLFFFCCFLFLLMSLACLNRYKSLWNMPNVTKWFKCHFLNLIGIFERASKPNSNFFSHFFCRKSVRHVTVATVASRCFTFILFLFYFLSLQISKWKRITTIDCCTECGYERRNAAEIRFTMYNTLDTINIISKLSLMCNARTTPAHTHKKKCVHAYSIHTYGMRFFIRKRGAQM